MKVNLPVKKEDSIDLEACDLEKGILVSKNPTGVIMKEEEEDTGCIYYYYYKTSDSCPLSDDEPSLTRLAKNLTDLYPNIEFEYFENE